MATIPKDMTIEPAIYLLKWPSGHFYVGQTLKPRKRRLNHLSRLRNNKHCNTHMQNVFNKYGDLEFHIIEECAVEELDSREQFYLDLLFNDSMCLNLAKDAVTPTRGVSLSTQTKSKISEANKGIKRSLKTRQKMSLAAKNRSTESETRRKQALRQSEAFIEANRRKAKLGGMVKAKAVKATFANGEVRIFHTQTDAAAHFGLSLTTVNRRCTGLIKTQDPMYRLEFTENLNDN